MKQKMKQKIIYVKRFKEYSWKHEKRIPRNVSGGKELLAFCKKLEKFFMVKYSEPIYFDPDNGFFEAGYSHDNISLWADFGSYLGAIISFFTEDEKFMIKWQDSSSKSLGWSDIEMLYDV